MLVENDAKRSGTHLRTGYSAAILTAPGTVEMQPGEIPEPGTGQVRVRLEGCGVCASNLAPWAGAPWFEYPFPPGDPGHEGWGVIDRIGPGVAGFAEGDRVATLSSGSYATHVVVPAERAIMIPDELAGVPVPGEPLGCVMNIHRRSAIEPGETVAIIGAGFLGLLLTQLAARDGARVIAISRRPSSLHAAELMGAGMTVPMDDHWRIIEEVKEATGGVMCDRVIEAVGKQWPLDLAGELTREGGRMIVAAEPGVDALEERLPFLLQEGPKQRRRLGSNVDVRGPSLETSGISGAAREVVIDGGPDVFQHAACAHDCFARRRVCAAWHVIARFGE